MKPDQPHPPAEELFAYRDGELPADRRLALEAHVVACRACRAAIDEVSGLEVDLRTRPDDIEEGYFERMTEHVLMRIAEADATPRTERRKSEAEGARHAGRGHAPRLSWPGVISTASAAAAVIVVVVLLARQGQVWRSVPRLDLLERSAPDAGGARGNVDSNLSASPQPASPGRTSGGPTPPANVPSRIESKAVDDKLLAKKQSGRDQGLAGVDRMVGSRSDAVDQAADRQEASPTSKDETSGELPRERTAAQAAPWNYASPTGTAYAALVQRFGIPPVWGPGVSDELILRAEPALRNLYRTGGAGSPADSARVRLYLAEAMRLRAGAFPDSASIDEITHHYRRAMRLAGDDPAAAATARDRLEDFIRETGATP